MRAQHACHARGTTRTLAAALDGVPSSPCTFPNKHILSLVQAAPAAQPGYDVAQRDRMFEIVRNVTQRLRQAGPRSPAAGAALLLLFGLASGKRMRWLLVMRACMRGCQHNALAEQDF